MKTINENMKINDAMPTDLEEFYIVECFTDETNFIDIQGNDYNDAREITEWCRYQYEHVKLVLKIFGYWKDSDNVDILSEITLGEYYATSKNI